MTSWCHDVSDINSAQRCVMEVYVIKVWTWLQCLVLIHRYPAFSYTLTQVHMDKTAWHFHWSHYKFCYNCYSGTWQLQLVEGQHDTSKVKGSNPFLGGILYILRFHWDQSTMGKALPKVFDRIWLVYCKPLPKVGKQWKECIRCFQ